MPHSITPQDVVDYRAPRDAQLSPDGRCVAFTIRAASKYDTPELPGEIWLADTSSGQARRFTFGASTDQTPRWSPDSNRLVFISDRAQPGQRQLYVIEVTGGEAQLLTHLRGHLDWPDWSPDGRLLAFIYTAELPTPTTPGDDAHVEDAAQQYARVYAIDLATHETYPLTPDGFQIHELAWSPTGNQIAVIATENDPTPSGWYRAQLYVVQANSSDMRQVCTTDKQVCALTWSPDGQQLAFLNSYISDQPLWSGDVCIVDAKGGTPRQITPSDIPLSFTKLDWREPDTIIFSARQLDGTSLGKLTVSTGHIETFWSDYAMLEHWAVPQISVSKDGSKFATVLERPDTPPQVLTGVLTTASQPWKQVSHFEYAPLLMGRMEPTRWHSTDGLEIAGHIVYPTDYQPGKRYPTVVEIHGGPAWSWLPQYAVWWEWWYQYLAGCGYVTFLPNIRGSTGRGTAYTEANIGDICGMDWQDVMTGIDHLIALGVTGGERLGIGGWSYGGVMTAWAVTQTTRFKAAIMGAGVANWESYYAQNGIRDWQTTFFGSTPYDNPALHRDRSPIAHIRNVRTPTLILHGQEDHDVPVAQAYEMYVALKTMGVETQMVTYPRENHPILERHHQLDLLTRVGEWFDRHLKD